MQFIICGGSFPSRILRVFSTHLRPFLLQLSFAPEIITSWCLTFFLTCQQVAFLLVNILHRQFCYPNLSSCLFTATSVAIYILSHYNSHYALSHQPYAFSKCNKNVSSHKKLHLWLEQLLLTHNLSQYVLIFRLITQSVISSNFY
jgi:hypothetical protein